MMCARSAERLLGQQAYDCVLALQLHYIAVADF